MHARSGDKGGDANLGLWVAHDGSTAATTSAVAWLRRARHAPTGSASCCRRRADLEVEVFALPNLGGVNVLIHGLLGDGVAASTRFDPQAKGLGEWAAVAASCDIPEALL